MDKDQIIGALAFLKEAERLKDVLRSSHTSGGRNESTAEHSWRLCLWVLAFEQAFGDIDVARLLKICIVHDLGEALSGDVPAIEQTGDGQKARQERVDLQTLLGSLNPELQADILALWDEYEAAATPEAKLTKGLDKMETILQHNQGKNPDDFDYGFNLGYGLQYTSAHPLLAEIRAMLDAETRLKMN